MLDGCVLPCLGPPTGTQGVASSLPRHRGKTLLMLPVVNVEGVARDLHHEVMFEKARLPIERVNHRSCTYF